MDNYCWWLLRDSCWYFKFLFLVDSLEYSSARCFAKHQFIPQVVFLRISARPTYSALPVNAKEILGDIRFRWKLLFHDSRINSLVWMFSYIEFVLWILSCTCWVFLLTLAFIWFLCTRWVKHAWEGNSNFFWAHIDTTCHLLLSILDYILAVYVVKPLHRRLVWIMSLFGWDWWVTTYIANLIYLCLILW
jgi:hypothetical protein